MPAASRLFAYLIAALCFVVAQTSRAQSDADFEALQQDVQAIKESQVQIQKDMAEIKKLLQQGARAPAAVPGRQAFKPTDVTLGDVALRGAENAPVTFMEFTDYQCPYCKRHATTVMPSLFNTYEVTGKVRFVVREFPIETLHRRAVVASEAALCAGDQGRYWAMHDALFEDQKANSDAAFQQHADTLELNGAEFADCMSSDKYVEQINNDLKEGRKLGITGTPSFVLGLTDPDDASKVHLTHFVRGAQPLSAFTAVIDELIKTAADKK